MSGEALNKIQLRPSLLIVMEDCVRAFALIVPLRSPAQFVKRESGRVTVWDVVLRGKTVRVVYDNSRGQLITALPDEAREGNKQ